MDNYFGHSSKVLSTIHILNIVSYIPHSPTAEMEGIMRTCEYQNIVSESGQISSTPSSGPVALPNIALKYRIEGWETD